MRSTSLRLPLGAAALALVLAACGAAALAPAATPEPTERPTPQPTPDPWSLDVTDAEYTTEAFVGDTITIDIELENTGTKANPKTDLNFSELDKYADYHRCKPKCLTDDLPGFGPSAIFPGVKVAKTAKFHVEFVATKVGVVEWEVCAYDDYLLDGDQFWCGSGTTAIR